MSLNIYCLDIWWECFESGNVRLTSAIKDTYRLDIGFKEHLRKQEVS